MDHNPHKSKALTAPSSLARVVGGSVLTRGVCESLDRGYQFVTPAPFWIRLLRCRMFFKKVSLLFLTLTWIVPGFAQTGSDENRGEIATRRTVTVASDDSLSYEVILPPGYDSDSMYPAVLLLHPGGWGSGTADHVQAVLDRVSWIVAVSNDFHNGLSSEQFAPIIKATRADLESRFAVDTNKVHLGGLSGGGMASYVTAYLEPRSYRGLLINSGVIHEALLDKERLKRTGLKKVALLTGSEDHTTSPREMDACRQWLDVSGIDAKIFSFQGGHVLAPVETYVEALEWLTKD